MKRHILSASVLLFATTFTAVFAQTPAIAPAASVPEFSSFGIDTSLTDQARIYAGMLPVDNRYARLTTMKSWEQHRKVFEENWGKLENRLKVMEAWRETALAGIPMRGATLFYPFSGPDFLNADIYFPDCDSSVFISLEGCGSIPSTDMDEKNFNGFLDDIRHSMADIFERNYFITQYMGHDFHTPYLKGNLPVFMIFLARRNCGIVSIDWIHVDSTGKMIHSPIESGNAAKKEIPGVEIRYVKAGPGQRVQSLYYFPVNIVDAKLKPQQQFLTWLHSFDNVISFTKAASYCMHTPEFSTIRNIFLRSKSVLEDDTGVPFSFFKPDQWNVTLFGRYTKPVKNFTYGYQKDLQAAFKAGTNVKPLPYAIGYHWRDGYSSLILATRKDMQTQH